MSSQSISSWSVYVVVIYVSANSGNCVTITEMNLIRNLQSQLYAKKLQLEMFNFIAGLGILYCAEIGSRNPSPSLCNVNIFCKAQCNHLVWSPSPHPSLCPAM